MIHALSGELREIRDAEEVEHRLHVGASGILPAKVATARLDVQGFLTRYQTDGLSLLVVAERLACNADGINPGLEAGRHVEVPQRICEDDLVGCLELSRQPIEQGDLVLLR